MFLDQPRACQVQEDKNLANYRTQSLATTTTVTSDNSWSTSKPDSKNRYGFRVYPRRYLRPRPRIRRSTRKVCIVSSETSQDSDHTTNARGDEDGLDPHVTVQQLLETNSKQEQLLKGLITSLKIGDQIASCVPSFSSSQSSFLEKYIWTTSRPDPDRLCDNFLARFNLPQILTGSYDPIEQMQMHMHGWDEQEAGTDIFLVTQVVNNGGVINGQSEIRWRHINQTREPLLAQQITRLALQIQQQWAYQGRLICQQDEDDQQIELDEAVDLYRLLCPGSTKTIVYQSSYNASGGHVAREPWLRSNRSLLGQLHTYDDRLSFDKSGSWDGRVFGRIWQTFHDNQLISFACIYLVLSQMGITGDTGQRILGMEKALRFLSCYAAKWPRFMQTSEVWLTSNWIQLQFHLRVLSVEDRNMEREGEDLPKGGLRPSRVTGKLSSLDGLDDFDVIEQRFSVALVTSYKTDLPVFTILYLTDSKYRRLFVESHRPLDVPYHGQFTAVAVYIKVLRCILPLWEQKWTRTLNEVDNLVGVKIDELFNPKGDGTAMMFDSSFARSRLYFTVLQALRIFSEWIQESERALQQLRDDFDKAVHSATKHRNSRNEWTYDEDPPPFRKEIGAMWDDILACHSSASKCLLGRIEKKNEEIKSFRDGLFSATSVREASRATILNQYILVFTFVTIFYLPLSYASSLFSMDVFSYEDASRGQTSFLLSTAMIAVVTWIASGIVLWVVHDDERVRRFQSYIGGIKARASTLHKADRRSKAEEPPLGFQGV